MEFVPRKLYYKIGEACRIVGVPAHVLRYWETEFPSLAPPKNRGGHRTYRPADIQLLLHIRRLLYEDGFTIAGARKRLAVRGSAAKGPAEGPVQRKEGDRDKAGGVQKPSKERLSKVREELENILTLLDRG